MPAVWGMIVVLVLLMSPEAQALGDEPRAGETLTQYLTPAILEAIFPGADRVGEVSGTPPASPVSGRQLGICSRRGTSHSRRVFRTVPLYYWWGSISPGTLREPGLCITPSRSAFLGLKDEQLHGFVERYKGHDLSDGVDIVTELSSSVLGNGSFSKRATPGVTSSVKVDAVSRATTSSVLMSDAIIRGGRMVGRSRGILGGHTKLSATRLDLDRFAPADWPQLEAMGAISHLHRATRRSATS